MIQIDKMTYAQYHEAVGHYDRRSEKAQREDIERGIATLYEEGDWWTLNNLRSLIGKLVGIDMDDPEGMELSGILFNLRHANLEALHWTSRCLVAILRSQEAERKNKP